MPFKVAIWDWNGTLVRDFKVAKSAMWEVFRVFAPEVVLPSAEEYLNELDMSDPAVFYYGRGVPRTVSFEEMRSVFVTHYKMHRLELNEGARNALIHLHGRGVFNAMVSAASVEDVFDQMLRLRIRHYFEKLSLSAYRKTRQSPKHSIISA